MKATKPAPTLPTYCAIFSNKREYSYLSTEPEGNMSDEQCGTNVRKCFVNCSSDTTSVINVPVIELVLSMNCAKHCLTNLRERIQNV